jgi:cation:H+ antiporter
VDSEKAGLEKFANSEFNIGLIAGIVLLVLFAIYMYWQISSAIKARKNGELEEEEDDGSKKFPAFMSVEMVILGIVGIIMGGDLVVDNATVIAEKLGMTETFIGLTIVAMGTSLPELVTSIVAARKGESDLALGNVIGSNVFNIVFILGASAVISPMTIDVTALYDTVILFFISIVALVFAITKKYFVRWEGATLLGIYAAYFAYILIRQS